MLLPFDDILIELLPCVQFSLAFRFQPLIQGILCQKIVICFSLQIKLFPNHLHLSCHSYFYPQEICHFISSIYVLLQYRRTLKMLEPFVPIGCTLQFSSGPEYLSLPLDDLWLILVKQTQHKITRKTQSSWPSWVQFKIWQNQTMVPSYMILVAKPTIDSS